MSAKSSASPVLQMPSMYTIRSIPGKAPGMFAEKDIKAGTRILEDELPASAKRDDIGESTIGESLARFRSLLPEHLQQFEKLPWPDITTLKSLSPEQLQQFEKLPLPDLTTRQSLMNRYLANNKIFDVESGRAGISLQPLLVNHSCCANAFFSCNLNLYRMALHAVVDIPRGSEITTSYCNPFYPLQDRQRLLREHYGFTCDCPACHLETAGAQRGEQRHQKMKTLYEAIDKSPREIDDEKLEMIIEFIGLAEDDHTYGLFLSRMYRRAKDSCEDIGLNVLALTYAQGALDIDMRLLGPDNPVTQESVRSLETLKAKAPKI